MGQELFGFDHMGPIRCVDWSHRLRDSRRLLAGLHLHDSDCRVHRWRVTSRTLNATTHRRDE